MDNNKKTPEPVAAGPGADAVASQNPTNSIAQTDDKRKALPSYYLVIPAPVAFDSELKPNAKLLYGMISALTRTEGYCWATNAYLAELTGLTEGNIGRLITQLEERGHIAREIARDEETNAVTGRKIWLCQPGVASVNPPCKNADPSLQKCGDPPGKKAGKNIILDNNIPPISPKGADERFENFWKLYPARKGRKNGKAQARTVWLRLKATPELYELILAGLDAYNHSDEVQRGYAMDAARWLRGRRWEDEVETTRSLNQPAGVGALSADYAEDLPGGFWDD